MVHICSKSAHFSISTMKFIVLLAAFLAFLHSADAVCCGANCNLCCGNGPCNAFCCNCDDGCSFGKRGSTSTTEDHANSLERFTSVDTNKNGLISLDEATSFLSLQGHNQSQPIDGAPIPEWFSKMDNNGDGYVSPSELDHLL